MAKISEVKNFMDDGWEINIKGKSQDELNKITEFVSDLERKGMTKYPYYKKVSPIEANGIPNIERMAKGMHPIVKPQGILIALRGDSMLDTARKVVDAVEYSIDIPKGLESLKFDRKKETRDRILELINYLQTYADWRE